MSSDRPSSPNAGGGLQLPNWFWVLVIALIFGVSWWQNRQPALEQPAGQDHSGPSVASPRPDDSDVSLPDPDEPQHPPMASDRTGARPHEAATDDSSPQDSQSNRRGESVASHSVRIPNQTIRDLHGNVVYKGTIDLTSTLDRIERGGANRHRNDGTTFQNREGRLPRKPAGYYKEYVHPTPGEQGPGPQRVIVGREGEIWYTPDHYKSFREIQSMNHGNHRDSDSP